MTPSKCFTLDDGQLTMFMNQTLDSTSNDYISQICIRPNHTIKERPWLRREQNSSMNIRVIIVCKGTRKPTIEFEIHEEGEWICNLFLFPILLNFSPTNTFYAIIVKVKRIIWRCFSQRYLTALFQRQMLYNVKQNEYHELGVRLSRTGKKLSRFISRYYSNNNTEKLSENHEKLQQRQLVIRVEIRTR
jgi:hypothetical protein